LKSLKIAECNRLLPLAGSFLFLENGRQLLAAFQKSFVKIRETGKPIGRKRLKFRREDVVHEYPLFGRVLKIQKH
jgi:hypothetical protein